MTILWAFLFLVAILIAWATNLFGLPGNWLMLTIAVLYWLLKPVGDGAALSLTALLIVAALAGLGELLELLTSSAKVSQAGGSRRSAMFAILGSIVGGCVGLFVGFPLPVLGPIVGSLFFGSLGAMAGAIAGEFSSGKTLPHSLQVGKAAFFGRALGTLAKLIVGLLIVGVIVVGILI